MVSGPSPQQRAAFHKLPQNRRYLLQIHWRWGVKGSHAAAIVDFYSLFVGLGVRIVSQARHDLLAIGEDTRQWSEFWLLEFPSAGVIEDFIDSRAMQALMAQAEEVEALVASLPAPRMLRLIKLLNRVLPILPKPRSGRLPSELSTGGINPSAEQMQAFETADQNSPIHMFNLLKFHQKARYADGDRGCSGQVAYEKGYGRVAMACFLRLGGRIVALGRYRLTLVGAQGEPAIDQWDEIAVVQYPMRPAFLHMISNPGYQAALEHRDAGLAQTLVWSTTPAADYY